MGRKAAITSGPNASTVISPTSSTFRTRSRDALLRRFLASLVTRILLPVWREDAFSRSGERTRAGDAPCGLVFELDAPLLHRADDADSGSQPTGFRRLVDRGQVRRLAHAVGDRQRGRPLVHTARLRLDRQARSRRRSRCGRAEGDICDYRRRTGLSARIGHLRFPLTSASGALAVRQAAFHGLRSSAPRWQRYAPEAAGGTP
jgi:hypothetical protein